MKAEIEEIREYTRRHPELMQAHHFLFNLPFYPGNGRARYVVMGINPGEGRKDPIKCPAPTEETSEFDFHEKYGGGRYSVKWTRTCVDFLGTKDIIQSELFFWSSYNMDEFNQRFGPLEGNAHLPFCTAMNRRLLAHHSPEAVICPGLGMRHIAAGAFGLLYRSAIPCPDNPSHRLIDIYSDGVRPWVFTKHWSGARGFTRAQRDEIKRFVSEDLPSIGREISAPAKV